MFGQNLPNALTGVDMQRLDHKYRGGVLCHTLPLHAHTQTFSVAGFPSNPFTSFMRIHENSAKQNVNQGTFPSAIQILKWTLS